MSTAWWPLTESLESQRVPRVSYCFKRHHLFSIKIHRVAVGPLDPFFPATVVMLPDKSGQVEHLWEILCSFLTNYCKLILKLSLVNFQIKRMLYRYKDAAPRCGYWPSPFLSLVRCPFLGEEAAPLPLTLPSSLAVGRERSGCKVLPCCHVKSPWSQTPETCWPLQCPAMCRAWGRRPSRKAAVHHWTVSSISTPAF